MVNLHRKYKDIIGHQIESKRREIEELMELEAMILEKEELELSNQYREVKKNLCIPSDTQIGIPPQFLINEDWYSFLIDKLPTYIKKQNDLPILGLSICRDDLSILSITVPYRHNFPDLADKDEDARQGLSQPKVAGWIATQKDLGDIRAKIKVVPQQPSP